MKFFFTNTLILLISGGYAHATSVSFENITDEVGIDIVQASFGNPSIVDYDKDGFLDIYIGGHGQDDILLNRGAGSTYTNIMAQTDINPSGDQHGIAWGDYDRDGDLDLFITMGGSKGMADCQKTDKFYSNNGDGTFTDLTLDAGVQNECGRGRSVNFVDYNNDGWLDIFLVNFQTDNVLYKNNGDSTFDNVSVASGLDIVEGSFSSWSDVDGDGDPDVVITGSGGDTLCVNNGNGTFTVSASSGFLDIQKGGALTWGDYDMDGDEDLFVTRNYSSKQRQLYSNTDEIRFSDKRSEENGIDFQYTGSIVKFDLYYKKSRTVSLVNIGAVGTNPTSLPVMVDELNAQGKPDYNSTLDTGFFLWKDTQGWHLRWTSPLKAQLEYGIIEPGDAGQFSNAVMTPTSARVVPTVKSTLYRNDGDGSFTDVTDQADVASFKNNIGATWGDFDNDGDLDLYIVNASDFRHNGPNTLFLNNSDGTFSDASTSSQAQADVMGRGEGCIAADLNNDGYLDLYITNGRELPVYQRPDGAQSLSYGPNMVLNNMGGNHHWLKLVLKGSDSNLGGIGANVCLKIGANTICDQYFGSNSDLFSQSILPMHFGLGSSLFADEISVHWPSGKLQVLKNVAADAIISIDEADADNIAPLIISTHTLWDGYIKETGHVYDGGKNIRIGDNSSEQELRGFIGFDLSQLPAEVTLIKATLNIKRIAKQGDPSLLGSFTLDSVDFGEELDSSDFSLPALLTRSISNETFATNGWVNLDITDYVYSDLESDRQYSHIRLRSEQLSSNTQADLIRLATAEKGTPATLTVEYTTFIQHRILTSASQDGTIADGKRAVTKGNVVYVGINTSDKEQRSYFGFDILSLPSEDIFHSAKLHLFMNSKSGDILQLENLLLDHIDFGESLDANDFNALGSLEVDSISASTLTAGSWVILDVSNEVANDILQLSPRSQFRLRPSSIPLGTKRNVRFTTWETGENRPFLEVNFTPAVSP